MSIHMPTYTSKLSEYVTIFVHCVFSDIRTYMWEWVHLDWIHGNRVRTSSEELVLSKAAGGRRWWRLSLLMERALGEEVRNNKLVP
jgi:hypothetical protein